MLALASAAFEAEYQPPNAAGKVFVLRRHVDDPAAALGTHDRDRGACQPHRTEQVDLEDAARLGVVGIFQRAETHGPCVVDQDVQATGRGDDRAERSRTCKRVSHVHRDGRHGIGEAGPGRITRTAEHLMAG